ncbi:hypothetical protein SAMN05216420_12021 [Nitrosospira sp. Nl5]|nr:hypothetical protein SAMN05216420_12021 [Nitrosospira sp. Nl5]
MKERAPKYNHHAIGMYNYWGDLSPGTVKARDYEKIAYYRYATQSLRY